MSTCEGKDQKEKNKGRGKYKGEGFKVVDSTLPDDSWRKREGERTCHSKPKQ
jgi:hypothetical protein